MRDDDYLTKLLLMTDSVLVLEGPSYGLPVQPSIEGWWWIFCVQETRGLDVFLDMLGCIDADI